MSLGNVDHLTVSMLHKDCCVVKPTDMTSAFLDKIPDNIMQRYLIAIDAECKLAVSICDSIFWDAKWGNPYKIKQFTIYRQLTFIAEKFVYLHAFDNERVIKCYVSV